MKQIIDRLMLQRNSLDQQRIHRACYKQVNNTVYPYVDLFHQVRKIGELSDKEKTRYKKNCKLIAAQLIETARLCFQKHLTSYALNLLFEAIALNQIQLVNYSFKDITINNDQFTLFEQALITLFGINCKKNVTQSFNFLSTIKKDSQDYADACFLQGILTQHNFIETPKHSPNYYFKQAKKYGLIQLHYHYPLTNCRFFSRNKNEYIAVEKLRVRQQKR